MYCFSYLHSECNLTAAVFINLLSVYIYLGIHGCLHWSFFIHVVFLKPYYSPSSCQINCCRWFMMSFWWLDSVQVLGVISQLFIRACQIRIIITSSTTAKSCTHIKTLLWVQSRSHDHVQDDVNTCSAASSIIKKGGHNMPLIYIYFLSYIYFFYIYISLIFKIMFLYSAERMEKPSHSLYQSL